MFVKPAAGLQVRDPVLRDLLPPEGREVPDYDPYWLRRLRDGDVIRATPPAQIQAQAQPAPPRQAE